MEDDEYQRLIDEAEAASHILGNPIAAFEILRYNLSEIHSRLDKNEENAKLDSLAAVLMFLRQAAPDVPKLGEALSLLYTDLATAGQGLKKPPRAWPMLARTAAAMAVLEEHDLLDQAVPGILELLIEQKLPLGRSKHGVSTTLDRRESLANLLKNFQAGVQDRRMQRIYSEDVKHYRTVIAIIARSGPIPPDQLRIALIGELQKKMRDRPYRPAGKRSG